MTIAVRELFPESMKLGGVLNGRCLGNEDPDPALPCPTLGAVIWKALWYLLSRLLHEAFLAPLWFSFSSHRRMGDINCLLLAPLHLSHLWLGLSPETGHGTVTSQAEKGPGTPACLNVCSSIIAIMRPTIAAAYLKTDFVKGMRLVDVRQGVKIHARSRFLKCSYNSFPGSY